MKVWYGHAIRASALLLLMLCAAVLQAQDGASNGEEPLSRDSLLAAARAIMDASGCQALVTVDEHGKPRIRQMSPFAPEENGEIWLGTAARSRKVGQIRSNPNVVLFYYAQDQYSYVAVAGTAHIVDDPALKKKYWKKGWEAFFEEPGEDYVLLRVRPETMEIFSPGVGMPDLLTPLVIDLMK